MVRRLRLAEVMASHVKIALDPDKPNLSAILSSVASLVQYLQHISPYEKMVTGRIKGGAQQYEKSIVDYDVSRSLGSIMCRLDKTSSSTKTNDDNESPEVTQAL